MTASEIRTAFKFNWMFQVYQRKPVSNAWIPLLMPLSFWMVGLIGASLQGVLGVFVLSPLAYIGPVAIGLTLLAYWWFTIVFPNALVMLQDALGEDNAEANFKRKLERWGEWFGGWRFIIPVTVIILIFSFVSCFDIARLFFGVEQDSLWASWVHSDNRAFFQAYLFFVDGIVLSALLGSGFITLLACVLIIQDLLRLPLKLAYYRRLRAISDLSVGISLWTLLAIVGIVLSGMTIITSQPNVVHVVLLLPLPLFASFGLLLILFMPVVLGRWAIIRAKRQKIALYEAQLHALSMAIDSRLHEFSTALTRVPTTNEADESTDDADITTLLKERELINAQIKEVESIQTLPISWVGLLQLIFTSASPALGVMFTNAVGFLNTP